MIGLHANPQSFYSSLVLNNFLFWIQNDVVQGRQLIYGHLIKGKYHSAVPHLFFANAPNLWHCVRIFGLFFQISSQFFTHLHQGQFTTCGLDLTKCVNMVFEEKKLCLKDVKIWLRNQVESLFSMHAALSSKRYLSSWPQILNFKCSNMAKYSGFLANISTKW